MQTIGLTGGIGMGKSTAAEFFRRRGLALTDSDVIARQIVEPGQPALAEIGRLFGKDIIDDDGCLRRAELAQRIFTDTDARRKLEGILHPRIRAVWQHQFQSWRAEGRRMAVAVIPLLFETGAAGQFDATICVACSASSQRQRLRARGWSDRQIDQRIAAQLPAEKKILLADYVAWTEGPPDVLEAQLDRILRRFP